MLMKKVVTIVFWLVAGSALNAFSQCVIPADLGVEVKENYPAWSIVTPEKLTRDDRATWKSLHPKKCPGLLEGKFLGAGSSFAVALVQQRADKIREQVILLTLKDSGWDTVVLVPPRDLTITNVLVKLPPGRYTSFDGAKKVKIDTDSIAVVQLEARASILYWDGSQFRSIAWSY
jgi:hypothetical protein